MPTYRLPGVHHSGLFYGELLYESRPNLTNNDYLYGGKELQDKFGVDLYDSQARFQSNTGAFLSIDPMAEKYYSISPYAYCAGNPINLVDPEGREIWIIIDYDKKTRIVKEAVQYKDGKLYTKGGDEYKGENSFANRILVVLNDLKESKDKESQQVLNKLETSENKHRFYSLKGERKTMPKGIMASLWLIPEGQRVRTYCMIWIITKKTAELN